MRQLFWKEWYELRLLPLASAVCVTVLIFAAKAFNHYYEYKQPFQYGDTILPLLATWGLFALLAGASLIAQEIGSGSLLLLSSLPVSRPRLWWIKVVTALGMLLLSVLSSGFVWAIIDAFTFRGVFFGGAFWHQPASESWGEMGVALLPLLGLFAVALAVSPFLDRPISAVIASLLAALACFALLESLVNVYVMSHSDLYFTGYATPPAHDSGLPFLASVALCVPVFAAISYFTFTRGETLRSPKRFRVGAITGGVSLVVAGSLFFAGSLLSLW